MATVVSVWGGMNPYPVGSIYLSINSTNLATLFGGTWEQIKDTFLLACGNTYAAGSTGGEAQHTLTPSEIPPHNHVQKGLDSLMVTSLQVGSYQESGRSIDKYSEYITGYVVHTANEGGGLAHNNMPPYFAMPFWIRTA